MLRLPPSPTVPARATAGSGRRAAVLTLALAGLIAVVAPGTAVAASKPCPRTGATVATSRTDEGASRIWRVGGATVGCTTIGNASGRPDVWTLSRKRISRIRLDGTTAAWTQHAAGTPRRARRVTAIDLSRGSRIVNRRRAIPATDDDGEREASVDALRVLDGGFVAWIADGSTVVVGAQELGDTETLGPDGTPSEVYLSEGASNRAQGYAGVAAHYPSSPAGNRCLRDSLAIALDDSDPDDAGAFATTWSWSPDCTTTVRAVMTGTR